jgi:ADP-heptose:LPS heptosyltransferase
MRKSIRILAFGGIGDAILLTPSLRALATSEPDRKIVVWTGNPGHISVFRHNPFISSFRYLGRLGRRLYQTVGGSRWLSFIHTDYSRTIPSLLYSQSATHIIADILGTSVRDEVPELFLTDAETAAATKLVQNFKPPLVVLHVKAASSPNKHWEFDNWQKLIARNPSLTFIQVGDRGEPVIHGAHSLTGIGLRKTFAVIQACDAFVGVDSGLGHAATAVQTPAVVLFGATTPVIWGHERNINLYSPRYCSPCIDLLCSSPCPFSVACMKSLSVGNVEDALWTQLGAGKTPGTIGSIITHG